MIDFILIFVASYTLSNFIFASWYFFYNIKLNLLSFKTQFKLLIFSLIATFIYFLFGNNQMLKIIFTLFLMILSNYFLFSHKIKDSIISALDTQFIIVISELITMIILNIILKEKMVSFISTSIGYFIVNIMIAIISLLSLLTKMPQKAYKNATKFTETLKDSSVLIYAIMIMIIAITSTAAAYLKWNYVVVLSINTVLIIIFIFISIKFASAKNKYNEISNKYETSISSLRQYEAMIDKYRIYNHENKNELQTLRNLISKKNTKALKYIDEILDDKIKDNEKIMRKTFKIPEGGLRAIIYGKLCKMDELGIKYSLDIARDVRTVDLINMDEEIVLNICKILGVFLDNAIEAVKNLKDKQITIEIYLMDGKLCIDITNNFEGKLELDKLDKEKYTTKGKNHGYGLSLVKQIIGDNSNIFENEKSISRNNFIQKLKIKM